MGKIIVITSGKGGVGKTTLTAILGRALADKERSVLLVDGDMGLRDLDLVLGMENEVIFTAQDLWDGECFKEDVILRVSEGVDFLPASQVHRWEDVAKKPFGRMLKRLVPLYDYILVDSPAGIGRGFEAILRMVDQVLVVVEPTWTSLRDCGKVMELLRKERFFEYLPVINMMPWQPNQRLMEGSDIMNALQAEHLGTMLPYSYAIKRRAHEGRLAEVSDPTNYTDSDYADNDYRTMIEPLICAVEEESSWEESQIFELFERLRQQRLTDNQTSGTLAQTDANKTYSESLQNIDEENAGIKKELASRRRNRSMWKWNTRRL